LNYKKLFLSTLIIALSISAAIGIFIFLTGDFGDTQSRILATTVAIGGFCLTGLCSSIIHHRDHLKAFSVFGMITSVVGFVVAFAAIWNVIDFEDVWQALLILIILSITLAHISLLLILRPKNIGIKTTLVTTIVFISIVSLMLIYSTICEFDEDEFYYRILGVFAILDVLGTITTPILNKISESKD
jgi:hypothetical protein